jgi:hypothetical protein
MQYLYCGRKMRKKNGKHIRPKSWPACKSVTHPSEFLSFLLQSLSFEIIFLSSQKHTGLDQFMTFFQKISRICQENSQAKPKNMALVSIDTLQVTKHDQAEFQPATQTDLG